MPRHIPQRPLPHGAVPAASPHRPRQILNARVMVPGYILVATDHRGPTPPTTLPANLFFPEPDRHRSATHRFHHDHYVTIGEAGRKHFSRQNLAYLATTAEPAPSNSSSTAPDQFSTALPNSSTRNRSSELRHVGNHPRKVASGRPHLSAPSHAAPAPPAFRYVMIGRFGD